MNKIFSVIIIGSLFFSTIVFANGSKHGSNKASSEVSLNDVSYIDEIYAGMMSVKEYPSKEVLQKAIAGFVRLKSEGSVREDKNLLTIIDFSKSSNSKRLWIIDLDSRKVVHNTYVAHGRNSGNEFAKNFSNTPNSYSSSLGFYITAETYFGKHGLSLRLDGVEKNINHNARKRAIVMHGADYVSTDFIEKNGRLGRSYGCPSVPMEEHQTIIETIKEGSVMFIYAPDKNYAAASELFRGNI